MTTRHVNIAMGIGVAACTALLMLSFRTKEQIVEENPAVEIPGGRGIWTTDFWLTLLKVAIGGLVQLAVIPQAMADTLTQQLGAAAISMTALLTSVWAIGNYIKSRTDLKSLAMEKVAAPPAPMPMKPVAIRRTPGPSKSVILGALVILFGMPMVAEAQHCYNYATKHCPTAMLPWRSNVENLLQQIAANVGKQQVCPPQDNGQLMALQAQMAAMQRQLDQLAMLAMQNQNKPAPAATPPTFSCPCPQGVQHPNANQGIIHLPAPPTIVQQGSPYYVPPVGSSPYYVPPVGGSPYYTPPRGEAPYYTPPRGEAPKYVPPVGDAPKFVPPVGGAPVVPPVGSAPPNASPPVPPQPPAVGSPVIPGIGAPPVTPPGPGGPPAIPPAGAPPAGMQRLTPVAMEVKWYWWVTEKEMLLISEIERVGTVVQRLRNDGRDPRAISNCEVWRVTAGGALVKEGWPK